MGFGGGVGHKCSWYVVFGYAGWLSCKELMLNTVPIFNKCLKYVKWVDFPFTVLTTMREQPAVQ